MLPSSHSRSDDPIRVADCWELPCTRLSEHEQEFLTGYGNLYKVRAGAECRTVGWEAVQCTARHRCDGVRQ
jgi:hypothetical protein